jgi:hypothetical protein
MQNHDHSVEGDLANANSAQTVLYFFLLMLYKTSTCKIFWLCAVFVSQLCFLFVIYLRFIITLVKGMFDLQIDKNKKQKT